MEEDISGFHCAIMALHTYTEVRTQKIDFFLSKTDRRRETRVTATHSASTCV